ncbi:hypothetical protein B5F40_14885 [Gordonibacter sp. An230]|uniref:hypothetical protein n=1 Tax=Gordonibacter sp. An230 TaxID=1965592 RepID=UPI000B371E74|nr:hypothetical protein [Gordonibacter sp. An230]OUO86553.1 hypothetical protein B5F40_14885 [Gordonibacter sp. An230]
MSIVANRSTAALYQNMLREGCDSIATLKSAEKVYDDNTAADQGRYDAFSALRTTSLSGLDQFRDDIAKIEQVIQAFEDTDHSAASSIRATR